MLFVCVSPSCPNSFSVKQIVTIIVVLILTGTHFRSTQNPELSEWSACDRPLGVWGSLWVFRASLASFLAYWEYVRHRRAYGILPPHIIDSIFTFIIDIFYKPTQKRMLIHKVPLRQQTSMAQTATQTVTTDLITVAKMTMVDPQPSMFHITEFIHGLLIMFLRIC